MQPYGSNSVWFRRTGTEHATHTLSPDCHCHVAFFYYPLSQTDETHYDPQMS